MRTYRGFFDRVLKRFPLQSGCCALSAIARSAPIALRIVATTLAVGLLSGNAIAQSNVTRNGNNLTLTCDGNFSPLQTLCKDGNYCNNLNLSNPPVSSASPQDNVSFVPSGVPVNVTWEIINPDTTSDPPGATPAGQNDNPVSYSIDGIGTFSLLEGVTDTKTQTATSPPAVKIEVNHTGVIGNEEFGVIRYRVKCTPATGKLKIIKNSIGGTDTFAITATPVMGTATNFSVATMGAPNGTGFQEMDVAPGAYTIAETPPAGWTLTSIVCDTGGGATATVTVGQTTTCTVTNTRQTGSIKLIKNAIGDNGTFTFNGSLVTQDADFGSLTTVGGTAMVQKTVPTNTYAINEIVPAGWTLTSASCTSSQGIQGTFAGTGITGIVLDANETITCTFNNTRLRNAGSVTIIKNTLGGDGTFNFTGSLVTANAAFASITTNGNTGQQGPFGLASGATYTITETAPANGFTFTSLTCVEQGGTNTTPTTFTGATATINLDTDENVTCTYTNTKNSSVTIIKNSVGGDGTFNFTGTLVTANAAFASITTNGNTGQQGPFGLASGMSYTITETAPANGFTFTSLTCVEQGGTNTTPTTFANATASINLDAGESVTCTYTNTRQTGKLTVKKVTVGDPDQFFSFTINAPASPPGFSLKNGGQQPFDPLETGTYTVIETQVAGYTTTVACVGDNNGNASGNVATVNLDNGEDVTCTFTNLKEKDDRMEEETRRFIHRRVDNLLTYGPDRARMLRRLQEQPQQQSLKDDPLKFSGASGASSGAFGRPQTGFGSWPMSALGMTATSNQLMRGHDGSLGYDGVLASDPALDDFGSSSGSMGAPSMLSNIAAQFTPLAAGQTSFKFGTSLSEIRATAAAAEVAQQRKKLEESGLGFADQSYVANPYLTMRQGLDIWIEGHVAKYNDGIGGISRDGDFKILYVGADYVLAPGILVGALVQVDDTKEDISDPTLSGDIEGTGWMAGPYIGIRVADNVFFDARAAWGQSDNDILLTDIGGTRSGSFDTDRWLASASLTGSEYFGAWRLSPQIAIAYGNEESDAYTNTLGQTIASTEATIGRLTGTFEIGYRINAADGTVIEPHVAIAGIWNFDTDRLSINGILQEPDETRAKVEGGVLIRTPSGWGVRAAGSYDGIGGGDFDAYSGSLWINVPFN